MNCWRNNGFTLMEMVITLTMVALMTAVAAPYLSTGVQAFNETASAIPTLSKLRTACERIVREVREVQRNPSGNYDISLPLNASSLSFTKSDGETVTIDQSGSLVRLAYGSVAGAPTLIDEVSGLTISYWRTDGTTPAIDNTDVAFIEFEFVVTHNGNTYPQRSRVSLRNQP
jgi:prepilin-type N-terminal cleavage/methylation domain-containing protein